MGLYSTSSGSTDSLSDENGVFSSGSGSRLSKCLEIRLRRGLARLRDGDARAASGHGLVGRGVDAELIRINSMSDERSPLRRARPQARWSTNHVDEIVLLSLLRQ